MPPAEHRLCCATKVCVWPLQGVEQESHGAVGSSLQAFRQILQILQRQGPDAQRACSARQQTACHCSSSEQWAWAAHLLAHRPVLPKGCLKLQSKMLCNWLKAHSVCVLWKSKHGNHLWYTPGMLCWDVIVYLYTHLVQNRDFWCLFQFSLKNRMRMKRVSFEVRGVTWQQIWETDSWRSIPWKTQLRRVYTSGHRAVLWEDADQFNRYDTAIDTGDFLFQHALSGWTWGRHFTLHLTCSYLHCKVLRTCWKDTGLNKSEAALAWSLKSLAWWWMELFL